jgi:S-DNA-T family DNA segregation ATPase FtsK/SpoIIIE
VRFVVTLRDGSPAGSQTEVLVDAEPDSAFPGLMPHLLAALDDGTHPSFAAGVQVWVDGVPIEPAEQHTLASAGVRPGAIIELHTAHERPASQPAGVAEIRVVNGPGAGRVHRIPLGHTVLGHDASGMALADRQLPALALTVIATAGGQVEVEPVAGVGLSMDGEQITSRQPWPRGAYLVAGHTVLELAPVAAVAGPPPASADATLTQPMTTQHEAEQGLPRPARRWRLGGRQQTSRTGPAGRSRRTGDSPAGSRPAAAAPLAGLDQTRAARKAVPDPASLLLSAVAHDATVWRRAPGDNDFLGVRLGLGERDGLADVPVWISLARTGVLGIAGDPETAHGLAAWLMAQCAVLHTPRQVRLAALTTNQYQARRRWEWLVRVPHSDPGGISTADDDPEPPVCALVGTDEQSIDTRLAELSALIADRRLTGNQSSASSTTPLPRIVVLIDGTRRLHGRPGLSDLLIDGPAAGVYTICIEDDENWLPPGCHEVIACRPGGATLRITGGQVRPDQVEPAWTDQVSRLLAPLRDVSRVSAPDEPQDAGLLALLGLDDVQDPRDRVTAVEAGWRGSPSGRVVIGTGHDGAFAVDLRLDGPHLLVAGDPQSQPGALLSVMIGSLAAVNRPDDLTAILISTGSGPQLMACASLPHVAGVVDLSAAVRSGRDEREEPHQRLRRMLSGLSAELDRRDALLSQAGARDLEDFAARGHRLPRLLVAIDDVVELTERLPDGLSELISAAQRGESLGLHLLMGTSRPQDIASHEIASILSANASLRICLRVGSESASRAIIDAAEAARIPLRSQGRGYARTGHWPLLAFQAPRLGAAPVLHAAPVLNAAPVLQAAPALNAAARPGGTPQPGEPRAWALPWDDAGHPAPIRPVAPRSQDAWPAGSLLTEELHALAEAAQRAAEGLAIPPPEPPWMPPLPPVVTAAALRSALRPATVQLADPVALPHPWALEEHPDRSARSVASIELGRSGHLLVSGAPGSGRSTALRTIAGVLAERVSSGDLHLYGLDGGDGALACLDGLPHTGAVVARHDRARALLVLSQLVEEVAARHEALAAQSWPDIQVQRATAGSDDRLPYLLLVIDQWESLIAGTDGQTLAEQVFVLLRRGAPAGMQVVIGGDRSLLSTPLSAFGLTTLLLCPAEQDYRLAGLDPARLPVELSAGREAWPAGRGAWPAGRGVWADSGVQVQVSVLAQDTSGPAQAAAIDDIAARRARRNATIPQALRPVRL